MKGVLVLCHHILSPSKHQHSQGCFGQVQHLCDCHHRKWRAALVAVTQ